MDYEIKSLNIWSIGRSIFLVTLMMHLTLGLIVLMIIFIGANISSTMLDDIEYYDEDIDSFGMPIGFVLVIILSVSASLVYCTFYVVFSAAYNIISERFGGFEITLKESSKSTKILLVPKDEDASEEDSTEE